MDECSFETCTRSVKARGLCNGHYVQWQRYGQTWQFGTKPHRQSKPCSYPGCGKKVVSKGLCTGHSRQRRLGLELKPIRAPRPKGEDGYHWCSRCKQFQPVENFGRDKTRNDEPKRLCLDCASEGQRNWNSRNGLAVRAAAMKRKYGISAERYQALWDRQSGLCDICSVPIPNLLLVEGDMRAKSAVDHDHATRAVRGLLCGPCNTGMGYLGDDPGRLRAAAEYLEKHRP